MNKYHTKDERNDLLPGVDEFTLEENYFESKMKASIEFKDSDGSMMEKVLSQMREQKDEFVKRKFIEKGYNRLFGGSGKRRFPGLCKVVSGKWEYYFADNGSDNGEFIVAIKDFEHDNSSRSMNTGSNEFKNEYSLKIGFDWSDIYLGQVDVK